MGTRTGRLQRNVETTAMPISVVLLRLPGRLFENHDELKGVTYNGSGQEEYSISTSCDVGERLGGDRIAMATVGQYKCEACGVSFSTRQELTEHAKVHQASAAQYKCSTCGLLLRTQAELMEHAKVHQH
jgi:DNA-directed RNA polymerase subunit RPC12/RpoP